MGEDRTPFERVTEEDRKRYRGKMDTFVKIRDAKKRIIAGNMEVIRDLEKTINSLMDSEHERIDSLLKKFEEILQNDLEDAKKIFKHFKWVLEKHFFMEEKAIFKISQEIMNEEISEIFKLMQEHGSILEVIRSIERDLRIGRKPNVLRLKEILLKILF